MRVMLGFFLLGFIVAAILVMFLVDIGILQPNLITKSGWYIIGVVFGASMIAFLLN